MEAPSYDELWQSAWGDLQRFGPVHRHTLENLVREVSALNVRTVLDVGCGSGENLAALASSGLYELSGIDISREALNLAKERVPSASLHQLDVQTEALAERFDLVTCIQVIEHLADDGAALKSIAAMTNNYALISTMRGRMRKSELKIGHVRNYATNELRSKVESAGLEVMEISGWGFPFYSPLYRTVTEWLPGGPPTGPMNKTTRLASTALYHLYRLNWPGRGDVVTVMAKRKQSS